MKIAILVSDLINSGGGARQVIYLALKLINDNNDVTIFTPFYNRNLCFPELSTKIKIIQLNKFRFKSNKNYRLNLIVNAILIFIKIRKYNFDIINVHSWPYNWIVFFNKKTPIVYSHTEMVFKPEDSKIRKWLHIIERIAVKKANKIITIDNKNKMLVKKYYNIDSIIIRSGLEIEKLISWEVNNDIRKMFKIEKDEFLLFFLGFLLPHRRIEDVIEAVKILRLEKFKIKLLIGGAWNSGANYYNKLLNIISKYNLNDQIVFSGWLSESDTINCYYSCDAFIWPCVNQTWGLVVVEAMACGKPVIVSTDTGVSEIIEDNVNGLLIDPRNPKEIAEKTKLLIKDANFSKYIGKSGQKYVLKNLSWNNYKNGMLNVFN